MAQQVPKRILGVVLGAAALLLVPLVAMQFTNEVVWTPIDFAAAGILLIGTGVVYVLGAALLRNRRQRLVLAMLLAVAFLLAWAEMAVGLIGTPFAGS